MINIESDFLMSDFCRFTRDFGRFVGVGVGVGSLCGRLVGVGVGVGAPGEK